MRVQHWVTLTALFMLGAQSGRADNNSTDPPEYVVNRIVTPPTIDGVVSPNEWIIASDSAGDWVNILAPNLPDAHNTRFRMTYDFDNLYILGETDFSGFLPATDSQFNPDGTGGTYNPTLLFDPNADDEDLDAVSPNAPDGYVISWSMDEGFAARRPTPDRPDQALRNPLNSNGDAIVDYVSGLRLEAHVNSIFQNGGQWSQDNSGPNGNYRDDDHEGIVIALSADNNDVNGSGSPGGVWELAIAWEEFNATEGGSPDGLMHVDPPEDGEVWAFEASVVTPDAGNRIPSWSEPMGGNPSRNSAAVFPHGRIRFREVDPLDCNGDGIVDASDLECICAFGIRDEVLDQLGLIPGDLDGDGSVAFGDFLALSANFGDEVESYNQGDLDCNGQVAFADFLLFGGNFGRTRGDGELAAVPEPASLWLLLLGCLGSLGRRHRHR